MKQVKPYNSNILFIIDIEDYEFISKFRWYLTKDSIYTNINHRPITLGRLLLGLQNLTIKDGITVDHIDRNYLNNQKSNLRRCTHQQNCLNRMSYNKNGYKGISYRPEIRKWIARIQATPKKRLCLGFFLTKEEAASAYNNAAVKYHGEFARLNVIKIVNNTNL